MEQSMTTGLRSLRGVLSPKGEAKPPPEPAVRVRRTLEGRRVGATLPTDLYVRFKAYVARRGLTGEQTIVAAIEQLLAAE
jgi:hypothetical protein